MEDPKTNNRNQVSCDGGEYGHPLVYLHINAEETTTCPYCNKIFVYDAIKNT